LTGETRRGFFRLLGAAISVAPVAALAKGIAQEGIPIALIGQWKIAEPGLGDLAVADKIQRAFILLGLVCPGEKVSEPDYNLAFNIQKPYPNWTDYDLAFALWPYYNNVFRTIPAEDYRHLRNWPNAEPIRRGFAASV